MDSPCIVPFGLHWLCMVAPYKLLNEQSDIVGYMRWHNDPRNNTRVDTIMQLVVSTIASILCYTSVRDT